MTANWIAVIEAAAGAAAAVMAWSKAVFMTVIPSASKKAGGYATDEEVGLLRKASWSKRIANPKFASESVTSSCTSKRFSTMLILPTFQPTGAFWHAKPSKLAEAFRPKISLESSADEQAKSIIAECSEIWPVLELISWLNAKVTWLSDWSQVAPFKLIGETGGISQVLFGVSCFGLVQVKQFEEALPLQVWQLESQFAQVRLLRNHPSSAHEPQVEFG